MKKTINKTSINQVEKGPKNQKISNEKETPFNTEPNKESVKKRPSEIAREQLKDQSEKLKSLVKEGQFETINDALIETVYKNKANQDFKSYKEWKKEGYQVRKGEKAFVLWGRPKELSPEQLAENKNPELNKDNEKEVPTFYPMAYVFSNAQVDVKEREIENSTSEKAISDIQNLRQSIEYNDPEMSR
ncbi:MAG: ArdC family protein [Bacteroidota bacterium]|nr:ArdC family protein [Bacteroidota bacterium]